MTRIPEQSEYNQLFFSELEEEKTEEITLENVVVEALPTVKMKKGMVEWDTLVFCQPDIFHQERNDYYEVHARTYASEAKKKRLRPGDVVTLKGVPSVQEIPLESGEVKSINHLTVTDIQVLSRAERTSVTVYERQKKK